MSDAKHTPGEWRKQRGGRAVVVDDGRPVAMAMNPDDAYLIAASKELLAACQAFVTLCNLTPTDAYFGGLKRVLDQANAAIAKAVPGE